MTDFTSMALLPAGLRDVLPQDAAHEAQTVERLMAGFAAHGYDRVKPPLIEFESTLLAEAGAASAAHCFRVMDPVSQKMMALRADITPQVGRIAVTRLASSPRPLRLSYAGQVLRVKGNLLRSDRQFGQAGIELIGPDCAEADAEVAVLAAQSLMALGVADVSLDLTMPSLVTSVLDELKLSADTSLRDGIDHKDAAVVAAKAGVAAPYLSALLDAVGPADRALKILQGLDLPGAAAALRDRLALVIGLIHQAEPAITLTVDPVENRGFEYHSGVAFTLFARSLSGELGRGGRYLAAGREPAAGASLFMDTVLAALPAAPPPPRLYLPFGTLAQHGDSLRQQGFVTIAGLAPVSDDLAEAKRLKCGHVLAADGIKSV